MLASRSREIIFDSSDYILSLFVASPIKKDKKKNKGKKLEKEVECDKVMLDDSDDEMENSSVLSLPKPSSSGSSLSKLVTLQAAEGYWSLDTSLASIIGRSLSDLKSASPSGCSDVVWGTVLAIVLLESRFSSQHDEWELVAMKAEMWLQGQVLPPGSSVSSLKETAKQSLP